LSLATRLALLCLIIGTNLESQTQADTSGRKFGIGVMLNSSSFFIGELGITPVGFNNMLFPIRINPGFTLEPELGLLRQSGSGGGFESEFTTTRLGVGLLFSMAERGGLVPYVGPRFGWSRTSISNGTSSSRDNNWDATFAWGAQHYFSPHFTLGGELQLTHASVGGPSPGGGAVDQTFITTNGVVTIRWFF
jgi:hypothetical protein